MFGIIDSGFGGLSVVNELYLQQKKIDYVYFGDNLHNPYGIKDKQFIVSRTIKIINFLYQNYKINNLIIACNTMCVACERKIKEKFPYINIFYITDEVLKYFNYIKENKKMYLINILATKFTIKSNFYSKKIKKIKTNPIESQILVSLVEKNLDINLIDKNKLHLLKKNIKGKNLLLGCTHFYFLQKFLKKFISKDINIIDPSKLLVKNLNILKTPSIYSESIIFTTGNIYKLKKFICDYTKIKNLSLIEKIQI